MHVSPKVIWLTAAVALLSSLAAGAGLLLHDVVAVSPVTSVHGGQVELYGRGLYFRDSVFTGAAYRGTDAITLLLALPLLAATAGLYHRGSLAGGLLLSGILSWFLYAYASMALTATFNEFFLLYVALFATGLWAFVLLLVSLLQVPLRLRQPLPERRIAAFLLLAAALTAAVWLEAPLGSLASGRPPKLLGAYATLVTHALDLAVIVPALLLTAGMLMRREMRGYVLALPLLVLLAMMLPMIASQTFFQVNAGVQFTTPEIVGPIGGFLLFGGVAAWLVLRILRVIAIRDSAIAPLRPRRGRTKIAAG